jgi:hypothetical protein
LTAWVDCISIYLLIQWFATNRCLISIFKARVYIYIFGKHDSFLFLYYGMVLYALMRKRAIKICVNYLMNHINDGNWVMLRREHGCHFEEVLFLKKLSFAIYSYVFFYSFKYMKIIRGFSIETNNFGDELMILSYLK